MQKILERSQRLSTLVTDITELSRADLADEDGTEIDPKTLFQNIQESVSARAMEVGVELKFALDTHVRINSQPIRLFNTLKNLVMNGIEYRNLSRSSSRVWVRCYEEEQSLIFEISDNGVGISEEHQKKIFDRFSRFNPDAAEGSGLGLAIVKTNVARLGARLHFESNTDGTVFKLCIPALQTKGHLHEI